jgi:hypothetical protein
MPQSQVRQKWNDETDSAAPNSPASRRVRRIFAVLLLGALCPALFQYLNPVPLPATRFATIRVADYRPLTISPVPFLRPDLESLRQNLKAMPNGLFTVAPPAELERDDQLDQLDQIRSSLASVVQRDNDRLIVYVKAHGVSELDETGQIRARLLCGESYHPDLRSGRVDISEVLSAVSAIRSPLKLVILDCNHIASDVRLGMAANEFPRLTGELLADLQDQQLWVLLAGGTLQVSTSDVSRQRTPFAQSVSQALSGEADRKSNGGNGNRQLELREFYSYVLNNGGSERHVPILLRGGHNELITPDSISPGDVLVSQVSPSRQPVRSNPEVPDDSDHVADVAAADISTGDLLLDRAWLAQRQLFHSEALSASGDESRLSPIALIPQRLRLLEERLVAFDVRRRVGGSSGTGSSGLRELADSLEEFAQADQPGTTSDAMTDYIAHVREAWRRTQGIEAKQQTLRQAIRGWDVFLTTLYRLPTCVAWHDRASVNSREKHPGFDMIETLIRNILVLKTELLRLDPSDMRDTDLQDMTVASHRVLKARYIVEVQVSESLRSAESPEVEAALATSIPEIRERAAAVARLAKLSGAVSSPDSDVEQRLSETLLDGSAWQRNRALERLKLHALLLSLVGNESGPLKPVIDSDQLQALLTQPLSEAAADAYRQLRDMGRIVRDAYHAVPDQLARTESIALLNPAEPPVGSEVEAQRNRAKDLEAEADLVEKEGNHLRARRLYLDAADVWRGAGLIDPAAAALDKAEQQQNQLPEIWRAKLADQFASIEKTLASVREDLASDREEAESQRAALRALCDTPAGQTDRFALAALTLASSIDQRTSTDPALAPLHSPLRLPHFRIPTRIQIAAQPAAVPLVLNQSVPVRFVLTRTGDEEPQSATRVLFQFSNSAQDVEVRLDATSGEPHLLKSSESVDVTFDNNDQATITLLLTATEFASPSDSTRQTVRIRAEVENSTERSFAICDGRLPASDMVALSVNTVDALPPGVQSGTHTLRLFPNRTTHYRLSLVNQTLQKRYVRVRLFKATRPQTADWAPGLLYSDDPFLNPNPELFDGLLAGLERSRQVQQALAESSELELPSNGQPVPIAFKDVSPDADVPSTPIVIPVANVTDGLIALVTNLRREGDTFVETDQEWLHWVELDPIHPRQIFNCTAEWSAVRGVVTVQLTPKLHLPPGAEQKPPAMRCTLVTEDNTAPLAISREYGLAPAFRFENLPPTTMPRRILLDIDGYPRAFVLSLECPESVNRQATMLANRTHVQFQSVRAADGGQVFSRVSQPADGFRIVERELSPDHVPSPLMKRPVFKGRAADDSTPRLSTVLSVDVPDTFAGRGQTRDAIIVSIDGETASTFHRERGTRITLENASPQGVLAMHAKVSDHVISFRPNRSNGEIALEAIVQSNLTSEGQTRDTMIVLLDDTPPRIEIEIGEPSVTVGAPVIATVTATLEKNDAPLKFVEFGIDTNGNGKLDPSESFERRVESPGQLKYTVSTQNMNPGSYTILVRATDTVGQASVTAQASVRLIPAVAVKKKTVPIPPARPAPVPVEPVRPVVPAPAPVVAPTVVAPTVGIVRIQFTHNKRKLSRVVKLTATLNGNSRDAKTGSVEFVGVPLDRNFRLRLCGLIQSDIVEQTFTVRAQPASKATTISLDF